MVFIVVVITSNQCLINKLVQNGDTFGVEIVEPTSTSPVLVVFLKTVALILRSASPALLECLF